MNRSNAATSNLLLTIVARGNAIITELNRLIEMVPAPFKDLQSTVAHNKSSCLLWNKIICDFSYFKRDDEFEAAIESDESLKRADEEFCDTYVDVLRRFYLTFESVQRYASDLNNFICELEEDVFVGQSLDRLLADNEDRQLLCEAYFLLGYMLLTCDNNFDGDLRERIIVSYYRYSSYKSSPGSTLDDTCSLMRSTNFRTPQQQTCKGGSNESYYKPKGYPEQFFARAGVNKSIVDLLIAKMQAVDIYNQTIATFQHPDHRSAALSQQAAMLYVILFFCPDILESNRSRMREITNRFFYDNWIISLYMGDIVNLFEAWNSYAAARESLTQLHDLASISGLIRQKNSKYCRAKEALEEYLKEGWLNDQNVLEHHPKILDQIREANVVLRWFLLHSQSQSIWHLKSSKSFHSLVVHSMEPNDQMLYKFLQGLAELEKKFASIYSTILDSKDSRVLENKDKALELLQELTEMFTNDKPVRWIQAGANPKLVNLLVETKSNLETIDFQTPASRDLAINLIYQMTSAQESYSDGKNLQVVQLFTTCKESLLQIVRCLSLTNDMNVLLNSIGDFSYAWKIMDKAFTSHMQQIIKDNPLKVYSIKSVFFKLASAFETCLLRIQQVDARADLISISQYYSTKLVAYIRDVLQVIPSTILELVSSITAIQTELVMNDLPSKIPLENLRDCMLPEKRFQMLELTYKISHYAESLLTMEDTTIGLIRVNSRQLLEDGIRRELVLRVSDSIKKVLQSPQTSDDGHHNQVQDNVQQARVLLNKLSRLSVIMNGYKRSFEYVQDFLFIYGLKMWQEELNCIIKSNVDQATEDLVGASDSYVQKEQSIVAVDQQKNQHQQQKVTSDSSESSFLVRLLEDLLKIIDPRLTIYDEQMNAWYEQKPQRNKVIDLKVFELIGESLCVAGLNGLNQICSTLLMVELKRLDNRLAELSSNQQLSNVINYIGGNRNNDKVVEKKTYALALAKMAPHSERIVNHLLRIGQLQVIRGSINYVLSSKSRYEARNFYNCLDTLNSSMLSTLKHGKEANRSLSNVSSQQRLESTRYGEEENDGHVSNSTAEYSDKLEDSQFTFELTNHLDWIGLSEPLSKIYTLALQTATSSQVFKFREQLVAVDMVFLVLLDQCSKFQFSRSISGFVPKQAKSFYESTCTVDGQPFFYGLVTFINHLEPMLNTRCIEHPALTKLIDHMSLYVRCMLTPNDQRQFNSIKPQELTLEVANMILSLVELTRLFGRSSGAMTSDLMELLDQTCLPKFVFDTFQFTVCHLNNSKV